MSCPHPGAAQAPSALVPVVGAPLARSNRTGRGLWTAPSFRVLAAPVAVPRGRRQTPQATQPGCREPRFGLRRRTGGKLLEGATPDGGRGPCTPLMCGWWWQGEGGHTNTQPGRRAGSWGGGRRRKLGLISVLSQGRLPWPQIATPGRRVRSAGSGGSGQAWPPPLPTAEDLGPSCLLALRQCGDHPH